MDLAATARQAATTARVLAATGLVRPIRPDRLPGMGLALARYGVSLATGAVAGAARHPDRLAVVDEERRITYRELDQRSTGMAQQLAAMGLGPGDGVALLARNGCGFVEATMALSKLGVDVLYLNTGFAAPQVADVLEAESGVAVIYEEEFGDAVAEAATSVRRIPLAELSTEQTGTALPRLKSPGRQVLLTSGTTGRPKGAARSSAGLGDAVALLSRIPLKVGQPTLVGSPLFHTWGFAHLSLGMLLGSTLVLRRRFDPEAVLKAIEQEKVTALVAVPVMLQRLVDLEPQTRDRYDTSSLRVVAVSGSALSAALASSFMDAFGDVIYNLYGSTEVAYASIATPADMRRAPGTVGHPLVGSVVRLYDDDGKPVAEGETGRIFVGNAMVFAGYTGGEDKERIDGLVATGDVGRFDDDGLLFVEGRDDDMIVSGGENVFPAEVEDVLAHQDGVSEAAVIGVDDEKYGQRLVAYVVKSSGSNATEKDLIAQVKSRLANYKAPREIVFVDELPRNETGKVLHRVLREEHASAKKE